MNATAPLRNNATGNVQTFVPISGDKFTPRERRYLALYREENNGCWLFLGSVRGDGYGTAGRYGYAHRFFYERLVGPIPDGLTIDHLCRNRSCVNPKHLEPVTSAVNTMRGTGVGNRNLAKTHCNSGHEFTPENTRVYPRRANGSTFRVCLTCKADWSASRG